MESNDKSKAASTSNGDNPYAGQSDYKIIKDGWGSKMNFLASYGLQPTPEGFEEGKAILKALRESDGPSPSDSGKNTGSGTGKK